MRRSEREITDTAFMHEVLEEAGEIYVAMNTGGAPYILPFNFVFYQGSLFIHCACEGRKWELWRADPRAAFAAAVDIRVDGTTTRYRSVTGDGLVEAMEDQDLKNAVLRAFAAKYKAPCRFPVSELKFKATGLVRITIKTLTGKYSRPAEGPRPVPHYEH